MAVFDQARSLKGADDMLKLSKVLKAAGRTEWRKELNRALRNTAKPLIPKIRESARANLPSHGGLNERIAKKPYRAQVRTGAATAGVRITGSKVDPRINQGRVAHPVFGRPNSTVVQQVPSAVGYFDKPLGQAGPRARQELTAVLNQFAERIARSV